MNYIATEEDRRHFCTYDQASAAIPNELPFRSNGHRHVALNLSTGHRIPCADAYIAAGYVAGSAVLFPQWKFVLEMGPEQVAAFSAHANFAERLRNAKWQQTEQDAADAAAYDRLRERRAREAYNTCMASNESYEEF